MSYASASSSSSNPPYWIPPIVPGTQPQPTMIPWPPITPPSPRCMHRVDLGYSGDRLVGYCLTCGDRIDAASVPYPLAFTRAREILETYTARKLASLAHEDILDKAAMLDEIELLETLIATYREELDLALTRLRLVECDILKVVNEDLVDLQS